MQKKCPPATDRRGQIHHQDRLPLAQPQVHQPMRNMVPIGLERTASLADPDPDHRDRIVKGDRQDAQRRQDRVPRQAFAGKRRRNRDRRQAETDEIAAGIPHEEPRGGRVVPEESQQSSDQDQQKTSHKQLGTLGDRIGSGQDHRRQDRRRNRGHPRRQAVHVVQHVKGVDQADDPEEAERPGQQRCVQKQAQSPTLPHHPPGHHRLHTDPQPPVQAETVVGQAQQHHQRGGPHQDPQPRQLLPQTLLVLGQQRLPPATTTALLDRPPRPGRVPPGVPRRGQDADGDLQTQKGGHHARPDRHATPRRHLGPVVLPQVGPVQQPAARRVTTNQIPPGQACQQAGDDAADDKPNHGGGSWESWLFKKSRQREKNSW